VDPFAAFPSAYWVSASRATERGLDEKPPVSRRSPRVQAKEGVFWPKRPQVGPHFASCRAPTARQRGNAPPKGIGRTRLDGAPRLNTLRLGEVDGLRQSRRRPNGIKIQCSDASMAEDLAEFLRGLCFEASVTSGRTLEARFREPIPVDDVAARLQLDLYLRVWEAINYQASAARLSD